MRVYITMRNYLTWPARMAQQLAVQGHDVVFVDNDSTYPPLLEFYVQAERIPGVRIVRLGENAGPWAVWNKLADELKKDPYVVTDPDLDISNVPSDWPEVLMEGTVVSGFPKCGLSLDERRVPRTNPSWTADEFFRYPNNDHPARWSRYIDYNGHRFYAMPTDTTFALYLPNTPFVIGGGRVGPPYMARHLPWHLVTKIDASDSTSDQILMDDEINYYFAHADKHMSMTKARYEDEREIDEAVEG